MISSPNCSGWAVATRWGIEVRNLRQRLLLAQRLLLQPDLIHVPPGHPYSPLPSHRDVVRTPPIAGPGPREIAGIDLREDQQWRLVEELLPLYPGTADLLIDDGETYFRLDNTWFTGSDAVFLALMLQRHRPDRLVEVGSGWSTALALDVAHRNGLDTTHWTFVEPAPERLHEVVPAEALAGRLRAEQVQDTPDDVFATLGPGDFLTIDSSHVLKAGSDVSRLLLEVLPTLADGVIVHIHDIFHPFEYPASWLRAGVALNEAYAVRAVLQANARVRILVWNHYLQRFHRDWFSRNMPLCLSAPFVTGGLWLEIGHSR